MPRAQLVQSRSGVLDLLCVVKRTSVSAARTSQIPGLVPFSLGPQPQPPERGRCSQRYGSACGAEPVGAWSRASPPRGCAAVLLFPSLSLQTHHQSGPSGPNAGFYFDKQ